MENKLPVTTAIVDRCVKEFFEKGKTYVYERTESGDNSEALTEHAFAVFLRRMDAEHPGTKYHYNFENNSGILCYHVKAVK